MVTLIICYLMAAIACFWCSFVFYKDRESYNFKYLWLLWVILGITWITAAITKYLGI